MTTKTIIVHDYKKTLPQKIESVTNKMQKDGWNLIASQTIDEASANLIFQRNFFDEELLLALDDK